MLSAKTVVRYYHKNTFSAKKMQFFRVVTGGGYWVAMMCATMREVL
jgi:hypothetical protein